jgi:energy-coupling factor transporter ATP-binding protein EcfA2
MSETWSYHCDDLNPPLRSRLIGLAGPKGCGKSTIAKSLHVVETLTLLPLLRGTPVSDKHAVVRCRRFAGPLKAMLRTLGLTDAQVDGDEKELPCALLGGETPRHAMQRLGDWGRAIDVDLWVNATMLHVDPYLAEGAIVVLDDLRFENEALAIRKRGGLIIQLERPGVAYTGEHASEAGLPGHLIDHIVPNADEPVSVAKHVLELLRKHTS